MLFLFGYNVTRGSRFECRFEPVEGSVMPWDILLLIIGFMIFELEIVLL